MKETPTAPDALLAPASNHSPAPFLPRSRGEMAALGWDCCDVIIVTGDAYVDHPSFGMAVIGRLLEAQGFRVGVIAQPDWHSAEDFRALGRPRLFFGVTAGNMDSMINRYTAERRIRSDDAYSPGGEGGTRPDRSVVVYAQRCREAFKGVAVVLGGIEASLRRIAHYDYWSDKVRRSVLLDAKADLLLYGNAERAVVELARRLDQGEPMERIRDLRGSVFAVGEVDPEWVELESPLIQSSEAPEARANPYATPADCARAAVVAHAREVPRAQRQRLVLRLPAYEAVRQDRTLYAQASRIFHQETNPGNARPLVQRHGNRQIWVNPPPLPLSTEELDAVFALPYARQPHPHYGSARIPAFEMIQHSVNIMRGCFGGCSFCSITEHEGRIVQSRSQASILREIAQISADHPGKGVNISDLGGPTANMWRLGCKDRQVEAACRRPSCIYPEICANLHTDQSPLVALYRRARQVPGVKKVFIASGLRYDLAVLNPEYVRELVTHHTGGYLKIAPEHSEEGPLRQMMKPGMGAYERFRRLFNKYSRAAGKEQYLIPYFMGAHPGTSTRDMVQLALWLKARGFRLDQVQNFIPSPLAPASTMYHSGFNPLRGGRSGLEAVEVPKGGRSRKLHKALLRYHDPNNWPLIREELRRLGLSRLIGPRRDQLVPAGPVRASKRPASARRRPRR